MKRFQWFPSVVSGIAALGLVLPSGVFAADAMPVSAPAAAGQASPTLDVRLADGGVLVGQVVDAAGVPMPGTLVSLRTIKGQVISGNTDSNGRFEVRGLTGGFYEVIAAQRSGPLRLWAGDASPPGAVKQVLLVAGQPVARGQMVVQGPQGGQIGGSGAILGGVIILGSLGGVVAGGIISGLQGTSGAVPLVTSAS